MGEKYALLISEDVGECAWAEFWFDLVLIREALLAHGFDDTRIFVMHGMDGQDYSHAKFTLPRYKPDPPITDFPAKKAAVLQMFGDLASGSNGMPKITDEDLLFVWIAGHGEGLGSGATQSKISLCGETIDEVEFALALNQVPHAFRIICVQSCYSGGFRAGVRGDQTVFMSACTAYQFAESAETADIEVKNDPVYGEVRYRHWEFSALLFASLMGKTLKGDLLAPGDNADTDGNGVVIMKEAHEFIVSHDTQSETPQYDDGDWGLGGKLHLSFGDLFLRDTLLDTGREPMPLGVYCRSPDICHFQAPDPDPQTNLASPSAQNRDDLFEKVRAGQDNFIYVRVQNRGYSTVDADVDVYWTRASTLPVPSDWNFIGKVAVPSVSPGQFKVSDPLVWSAPSLDPGGYCFVAVLDNYQDVKPDVLSVGNWADFYNLVRVNNNVVWKNFDVEYVVSGGVATLAFAIQNIDDRPLPSALRIDLTSLPIRARGELKIQNRLTEHARLGRIEGFTPGNVHNRYQLMPGEISGLANLQLAPGERSIAVLEVELPDDLAPGQYEISVAQEIYGRKMGRVTKRLVVVEPRLIGNRSSRQVHLPDCRWVRDIAGRDRVPFDDLREARAEGYEPCSSCIGGV